MRHRINNGITGLGNPEPERLNNNFKLEKNKFWDDFLNDASANFRLISECGGFDYQLSDGIFRFGIEPSYERDPLLIIQFDFEDKDNCFIEKGISFGAYGSNVVKTYKFYGEYKYKSKFIKFIDKYYNELKKFFNTTKDTEDKNV